MPDSARVARTLVVACSSSTIQVAWDAGIYRVRHAADRAGRPLLLCRTQGGLDRALRADRDDDVAAVLCMTGPHGERAWISGWVRQRTGPQARESALDFAAARPTGDLLDVGGAFRLYRMDAAEIRVGCPAGHLAEVDLDAYVSAEPYPSNSPLAYL